jgi:hypothetical protein
LAKINYYAYKRSQDQAWIDQMARHHDTKFMVCALCETEFSPHIGGACPTCGNDDVSQFEMIKFDDVNNPYTLALKILNITPLGRKFQAQVKARQENV